MEKAKELPKGKLRFGENVCNHMLEINWNARKGWDKPRILPVHNVNIHPLCTACQNVCAGIEGIRAYKNNTGEIHIFRVLDHIRRLQHTCEELCFPSFRKEEFLKCLTSYLKLEQSWIPPPPSSLHLQTTVFPLSTSHPAKDIKLITTGLPTDITTFGEHKTIKLRVEEGATRAGVRGTGNINVGFNYAFGAKYMKKALNDGYQGLIWLNKGDVSQAGDHSIFFYWINLDNKKELLTPKLDGTVFPDFIRDTVFHLSKKYKGYLTSTMQMSVKNLMRANKEKRVYRFSHFLS